MKSASLIFALCFFGAATLTQASDLSALKHSCGEPSRDLVIAGGWVLNYTSEGSSGINVFFNDAGAYQAASDALAGAQLQKKCMATAAIRQKREAVRHFDILPSAAPVTTITPLLSHSSSDSVGAGLGFLLILGGLFVYFIPTVVAGMRGCKASGVVVVVNLFLGWTFIGWVVALAWAVSGEVQPKPISATPAC